MKFRTLGIILVTGICLQSSLVFSQNTKRRQVVKSKKTVYDFNEVDILGNITKPEGTTVKERPETYFRRLFDLDESFIPNIIRSVEDF